MTDEVLSKRILILKRLAWLGLVGIALFVLGFFVVGTITVPVLPLAVPGMLCVMPIALYAVLITIWHWKSRYRGTHSDLWGALLVIETSGWFKIIYLFRFLPDARGSGRYTRT